VILYEALTGRRPFVAKNYNALLVHILTSRHRPITELRPELPIALSEIVDKALSKMREDRYQSAAEFQETLLQWRRSVVTVTTKIAAPDSGSEDPTIVLRFDQPVVAPAREAQEAAPQEATPQEATPQHDTPVYPASALPAEEEEPYDPEKTIVDPPRFWEDALTVVEHATSEPGSASTPGASGQRREP
jgi:serine/threonine-protein kinase